MKVKRRYALMPQFLGSVRNPKVVSGLEAIQIPHEMTEWIQSEALDLFTVSSNAGMPFREALAVIWLSGMNAGKFAKSTIEGE